MFNKDFYPTPSSVIEKMLLGVELDGKVILEPSAGKGNIVSFLKIHGAKEVLTCEVNDDLAKIVSNMSRLIASDFLSVTAEEISHIDAIIMNPPFSQQEEHIEHAFEIAPPGCQIISLFNYSLISNAYTKTRTQLKKIIEDNGRYERFGSVFDTAERRTGVDVGCFWLIKPGEDEEEFDGYFDLHDYEQNTINESGIVGYNFVRDIVSRYVEAVKMFDEVEQVNDRINNVVKGVVNNFHINFGATSTTGRIMSKIDRATFKKELQKSAWRKLFDLFEMRKYVTTGVMQQINKFVEQQEHVPFTVRNVYLMIEMIVGTHGQRMDSVIVEAFERICSFSHTNSTAKEGWKTNTDFTINKKFILPHATDYDSRWPTSYVRIDYRAAERVDDVIKALCHMTGKQYSNKYDFSLRGHFDENKTSWGELTEWHFFKVRGYKKGTMHFEFIDEDLWMKFNQKVAEIKGWDNALVHTKRKKKNTRASFDATLL